MRGRGEFVVAAKEGGADTMRRFVDPQMDSQEWLNDALQGSSSPPELGTELIGRAHV